MATTSAASMIDVVRDAAVEVRKPTMFGELIIMIVYLPILTLEGIEGKMFRPMALTVIFALIGSMVLSLTLMPVLASLLLPRRIEEREPLLMRIVTLLLRPALAVLDAPQDAGDRLCRVRDVRRVRADRAEFGIGVRAAACGGAIAISVVRLTGTDLDDSIQYNTLMEKAVLSRVSRRSANTFGAASARPKSPPIRWASNSPTCSSRSSRATNGKMPTRRRS